jgi:mono/diheme cytochrome c family protein
MMGKFGKSWAAASAAAFFFCACAAALMEPLQEDAGWAAERWPGTTYADLLRGRTLYAVRCSSCHNLRRAEEYRADEWPAAIEKMEKGLAKKKRRKPLGYTPEERETILRYLMAMSARYYRPPAYGATPETPPKNR